MADVGQVGQVIASLDSPFLVEAAETVADQEKTEGHRAESGRGHRMGTASSGHNQSQLIHHGVVQCLHPVESATGPFIAVASGVDLADGSVRQPQP